MNKKQFPWAFHIAEKLEQKYHRLTSKFLVTGVFQAFFIRLKTQTKCRLLTKDNDFIQKGSPGQY